MQRQQQGFTLIELVIVIVILGVLSAFALPRFADLGGDAERASVEGARGAVSSASSIVHSAVLAQSIDENGTIDLEGETIELTEGYPALEGGNDSEGIAGAAQLSDDFDVATDGTISLVDGNSGCSFSYTEATTDSAPDVTEVTCD